MSSMAAAEGNTRDGSAPKIQATSMHRVGLTRLPPASMEYLMAPSSPSSLVSSVNLSPCRYSSKSRLCASQRTWLPFTLASLAMLHLAVRPQSRTPQHSPHESRRVLAGEPPGELDGLVDRHVRRHVFHVEHLVERKSQDGAVYGAHAVHRPPFGDLRERGVEPFLLLLHSAREPDGIWLELSPVLLPAPDGRVQRTVVDVALVQVQERVFAGSPSAQGAPSDPRQVLVGAGVHAYPVAYVDEERHLHDDACLQGRRLVSARRGVSLQAGVGLGDLEVHVRRRLHADHLAVSLADDILGNGHLLVGVRVHKVEQVSVPVQEGHLAGLGPDVLKLFAGAERFLHHGPAVDVPQARSDE